jgi:CheY-like chemotaxis protein
MVDLKGSPGSGFPCQEFPPIPRFTRERQRHTSNLCMKGTAAQGRPVILLVDDNPHDVVLIRLAFRKGGIIDPIKLVKDGGEAVRYLNGEGVYADRQIHPLPTLVLLDLKMPGTSGFEVLRWIREQPHLQELKAVVMTGSNENEDIQKAYDLGADSYLVKPANFSELVRMMSSLKRFFPQHPADVAPMPVPWPRSSSSLSAR